MIGTRTDRYSSMQPSQAAVNQNARTPSAQLSPAGWAHRIALILLLAATFRIRLRCLDCKPFWFDEGFSVELARIDWGNFLHLMWWREANMVLYYLLLRVWLHFGHTPFFIRSLSAVLAAATLPGIYWLARLLYDRRVALIAATLFCVNAYDVRYAQEARSYSLFVLLATLSSAFLISFLACPSRRYWRGYVLMSVLAVYSHLYATLLIVSHWIALRWFPPRANSTESSAQVRRAWRVIAIAILPLLVFAAKTGAGPIRWIHRPGIRDLAEFFENLSGGNSWPLALLYAVACAVAVAAAGRHSFSRDQSGQGQPWEVWRIQFLLIWLLFPVILTVGLSFARPVFLGRYLIFCLPPLVILAASGLSRLRRSWMLAATLAVMLFFGLRGVLFVYGHDFDEERDASSVASNFVLDHTQPGDAILFHIAATRVPYEFFRSLRAGQDTSKPMFTAQLGPEILFPHHGPGLDYRDFTGKPTADFLHSATLGHSRIWVMLMNNGSADKPDPTTVMLMQTLSESFPNAQSYHFARVELRLYAKQ